MALETVDRPHNYAERDQNENYKRLCRDYPDKFKYKLNPKDISLRYFVSDFDINWVLKPIPTVPIFSPTPKFVVKKNHKSYEDWCKRTLLMDKPGCYITNVGNNY